MRIDYVPGPELMSEDLASVLRNSDYKVLGLIGKVSVTHPDSVFAASRNFEILINRCPRFVRCGGDRIPLALTALRPLGRNARPANRPSRSFERGQFQIGRIEQRFMTRRFSQATHVLCFIPEVFVAGRGDDGTG